MVDMMAGMDEDALVTSAGDAGLGLAALSMGDIVDTGMGGTGGMGSMGQENLCLIPRIRSSTTALSLCCVASRYTSYLSIWWSRLSACVLLLASQ
jgi:hypothetical protein